MAPRDGIREPLSPLRKFTAFIGKLEERIGTCFKGSGRLDEELSSRISRFMQHFGFTSSPPIGTEMACIETESGVCAIGSDHTDNEPDLAPGWSAQYDESGNLVMLMTSDGVLISNVDGNIVVENGAGLIYLHEDGALDAARKTDDVNWSGTTTTPTTMAYWMNAVSVAINGLTSPGTITLPSANIGVISGGSSNVKIG